MRNFFLGTTILLLGLAISCKSGNKSDSVSFEGGPGLQNKIVDDQSVKVQESLDVAPKPDKVSVIDSSITRKIIRDGNMEVRVDDLDEGKKDIDTLVRKFKAYYSNESFNNADFSRGFSLTIRIPSESFDAFVSVIEEGPGDVVFKNISSRDVTEEFIDLETRLANKRNYLTRYGELLKKANTVKDILEIEEKIRLIEEEVESTQGRLKYLNNQVDYSTLNLHLSKKNDFSIYSNNYRGTFIDRLKMALVKGWFGLVSFVLFLIRIWPFWIIAAAVFIIVMKYRKKK